MQINTSSLSILPSAGFRRDGTVDTSPQRARPAAAREESPPRGAVARIRARAAALPADADFGTSDALQNLPARSRNALQSYLNNGPTMSERLGVDLAGVDVFA